MTDLHSIFTTGGKNPPDKTRFTIQKGPVQGTVNATLQLPGQKKPKTFWALPIRNGILTIPAPLIFMCHAKEDTEIIRKISERLLQDGILTWFDEKDWGCPR